MIKVVLVGYGKMGKLIEQKVNSTEGMECVGIFDPKVPELKKPFAEMGPIDVIIDFSHPDNLKEVGAYAEKHPVSLVLATTGYTEEQVNYIKKISEKRPVVYTANCSLGVTVLAKVLGEVGKVLSDTFDIEIIEKHHNEKLDSPSGTAKMLVDAVDPSKEFNRIYGREGDGKRAKEIGVHAIRGGNIVGEHTVIFAGEDEILEFNHIANSKQIFANGAVRAAGYIVNKPCGLYNMNNVLFE